MGGSSLALLWVAGHLLCLSQSQLQLDNQECLLKLPVDPSAMFGRVQPNSCNRLGTAATLPRRWQAARAGALQVLGSPRVPRLNWNLLLRFQLPWGSQAPAGGLSQVQHLHTGETPVFAAGCVPLRTGVLFQSFSFVYLVG